MDFFGGNDAKAETPVLWPPHAKSCLTGKDSDAYFTDTQPKIKAHEKAFNQLTFFTVHRFKT